MKRAARCVHCGKLRSQHHLRRSDGYLFLACRTIKEVRGGLTSSYWLEPDAPVEPALSEAGDGTSRLVG